MTMKTKTMHLVLTLCGLLACTATAAQSAETPVAQEAPAAASTQGTEYSKKGADTCLTCHGEDSEGYAVSAIFKGRHAQRGDRRAPFGPDGLQCEACHGPGSQHAGKGSKKKLTINSFKPDSVYSATQRNDACLACHQGQARNAWQGSAHERSKLACSDCHKMHTERDPALTKATETDVCYRCHTKQRADFNKTSSHPVRNGAMACSDCHKVHGSSGPALLSKPTLNQACFSCHADKRGPLLWEHAPVAEDCSLCHTAHGSVRAALLTKSPPLLCQQCHSIAGHASVPRTGTSLPGGSAGGQIYLVAGSCTNCHTQVHGSNHPAGSKLMH